MTEKMKKHLSKKRKEYLRKNPEEHPWKRHDKFKSVPCEKLKNKLKKLNIKFIPDYQPLYPERFYAIDIAFPDKKIGIEINGNQHYNRDGTLTDYYQKRHDLIKEAGWKLYEFHYSSVYNETINIQEILKGAEVKQYFDYEFWISNKEKKILKEKKRKEEKEKKHKENVDRVLYELEVSDIDFSKFGWVGSTSKIIGITPQKVGQWMQRNLPEFYEKCYIRKRPVSSDE